MIKNPSHLTTFIKNLATFLFTIGSIILFSLLFGEANTLVSVAIVVALLAIPMTPISTKPLATSALYFLLFTLCGLFPIIGEINIYLAFFANFIFLYFLIRITSEPFAYMPHITFLLCFIFSQSTQVVEEEFLTRVIQLLFGGVIIFGYSFFRWRKNIDISRISIKEQVKSSSKNQGYIIRMALGISIAILIGELIGTDKTLWISVVVMSLTQTYEAFSFNKIKSRIIATIFGVGFFIVIIEYLVPTEYILIVILSLGFLGSYLTEYKHKQFINTVSAINASLVLFDTSTAIYNRFLFLFVGIVIVLLLFLIEYLIKKIYKKNHTEPIIE